MRTKLEPKPKRDFTPLGRSYESTLEELFQKKLIVLPKPLWLELPYLIIIVPIIETICIKLHIACN